ncbi:MAG TPA: hypothetical protein VEZ50_04895 [Nodosilinea sp.]|nr:hypothetical protein [Nodosilinea sp.]
MNRFIIGGFLAALALILTGGLNRLMADRSQEPQLTSQGNTTGQPQGGNNLGALPLEQAGRLVQRQSEVGAGGTAATGDAAFGTQGNGTMPPGGRAEISPNNTGTNGTGQPGAGNVIPRTGGATTYPAATGDVAPIQPNLVQPDAVQRPGSDPDLDSIPALW